MRDACCSFNQLLLALELAGRLELACAVFNQLLPEYGLQPGASSLRVCALRHALAALLVSGTRQSLRRPLVVQHDDVAA